MRMHPHKHSAYISHIQSWQACKQKTISKQKKEEKDNLQIENTESNKRQFSLTSIIFFKIPSGIDMDGAGVQST